MSDWQIQTIREDGSSRGVNGEADNLAAAVEAAWALHRYTGKQVEVVDHRDGEGPRRSLVVDTAYSDEVPLVLVPVPEDVLRRLREIWETQDDEALKQQATFLICNLFDGQDGYLRVIDDVLGR